MVTDILQRDAQAPVARLVTSLTGPFGI